MCINYKRRERNKRQMRQKIQHGKGFKRWLFFEGSKKWSVDGHEVDINMHQYINIIIDIIINSLNASQCFFEY